MGDRVLSASSISSQKGEFEKIKKKAANLVKTAGVARTNGLTYGAYTSTAYAPRCDFSKYNF